MGVVHQALRFVLAADARVRDGPEHGYDERRYERRRARAQLCEGSRCRHVVSELCRMHKMQILAQSERAHDGRIAVA